LYLGLDGKRIFEAESDKIRGLDTDAFLAVANTIVPETGDIKVPDGGFTLNMKGNAELAKFQLFLYTKLKTIYAKSQSYINFAAKTGDGKAGKPVGDYGATTAALIDRLKIELKNPRWTADETGNIITAEFVKRMQDELKSIKESREPSIYLGLDGKSVIINEDLGTPGDQVASKPVTKKPQAKTQTKASTATNTAGVVGPLPSDTNKAWRYKVVKGHWHGIDTSDKSDTYGLIRNPKYIAALMAAFPNQGGHYLRMKKVSGKWSGMDKSAEVIGYTRKNNKWYISPVGGGSTEVPAGSQVAIDLDREYVNTKYVSGTPSGGVATTAQIDAALKELGTSIFKFVDAEKGNGSANFDTYSGTGTWGNDQEDEAWDNILYPQWTSKWKPEVDRIAKLVNASTLITGADKTRYKTSLQRITDMFTQDVGDSFPDGSTFYGTFTSAINSLGDTYNLQLLYSGSGSQKFPIDTDF
jgi:hypothetical protein